MAQVSQAIDRRQTGFTDPTSSAALDGKVFALYADTMNKVLGDFIREKRDDRDLSLREFAKKLGNISPAHISDIENGRRFPSEELLRKMAPLLQVTVEELQKHDMRPPVDELRKLVERDPTYGIALRKLTESRVTPDALVRFLDQNAGKKK